MRRRIWGAPALAILAMLGSPPLRAADEGLAGVVVDPGGQPVAGARVLLMDGLSKTPQPIPETLTDADGRFHFAPEALPPRLGSGHVVVVLTDRWAIAAERYPALKESGRIELSPAMAWAVSFRDPDGEPCVGLTARLTWVEPARAHQQLQSGWRLILPATPIPELQAVTDETGVARFQQMPAGGLAHITCDDPALARVDAGYGIGDGDPVVTVYPATSLQGQVSYEDGAPAAGATIGWLPNRIQGFFHAMATADADGRFLFARIPPGEGLLAALPPREREQDFSSVVKEHIKLDPAHPVTAVDLVLRHGVPLTILAVDAKTGQPVKGVAIRCSGPQLPPAAGMFRSVYRDPEASGPVVLRVLPGKQTIRVTAFVGHRPYDAARLDDVVVKAGQPLTLTIRIEPPPVTGRFRGRVVDSAGRPVAGAAVRLQPQAVMVGQIQHSFGPIQETTDQDGRFEAVAGEALKATAVASKGDAATPSPTVMEAGQETTLTLTDGAVGSVLLRVTGRDHQPLPGAVVLLRIVIQGMAEESARTVAGPDGRATLRCLPFDEYMVEASHPGFGRAGAGRLRVTAGESVDLGDIRLPLADRFLSGWVLDDQDKPVPGVNVLIFGGANGFRQTTTERRGEWRFDNLVEEAVELVASSPDGLWSGRATARPNEEFVVIRVKKRQ